MKVCRSSDADRRGEVRMVQVFRDLNLKAALLYVRLSVSSSSLENIAFHVCRNTFPFKSPFNSRLKLVTWPLRSVKLRILKEIR